MPGSALRWEANGSGNTKPFALVGVNGDCDRAGFKPVLAKEQITWRSSWNGKGGPRGPIASAWNVQGWPTVYVVDSQGAIRLRFLGFNGVILEATVDRLLTEMG